MNVMVSTRREIRRLAMQLLYQLDLRGEDDIDLITDSLNELTEDDAHNPPASRGPAMNLAVAAYEHRDKADAMATELAPDWPTYRQPPIDRAILRLAYHEIFTKHAPAKVVINESVELAKAYGSENSQAFINGVLDKMARQLGQMGGVGAVGAVSAVGELDELNELNELEGISEAESIKEVDGVESLENLESAENQAGPESVEDVESVEELERLDGVANGDVADDDLEVKS